MSKPIYLNKVIEPEVFSRMPSPSSLVCVSSLLRMGLESTVRWNKWRNRTMAVGATSIVPTMKKIWSLAMSEPIYINRVIQSWEIKGNSMEIHRCFTSRLRYALRDKYKKEWDSFYHDKDSFGLPPPVASITDWQRGGITNERLSDQDIFG